jgi:outer membrane receptor protein involved in Fe transport
MLRLPNNRASFRLNKYESTSGPDNSTFRNDILAPIIAIEETLYDAGEARLIPPYQASPGFDPNPPGTFFYEVTSDKVSRGYEAELVANPTRNWRLALNAAKAEATESNIGRVWLEFVKARLPYWSQHGNVQGPGAATNTVASRVLGIAQTLNLMRQADGQSVEQGRDWRANLVTRYSFDEAGRFKGFFAGGGYRWRSKSVIGYRAIAVPNEFSFPGVPAEITVPALDAPVFGDALHEVEGFVGYSRRVGRGTLRVQLNVRNLFDDDEPIAQRANTSGDVTILTLPQPRTFVLTTTFAF